MNGAVIITGDHGNAEEKLYRVSAEKRTKHTTNPVPFFIVTKDFELKSERLPEGISENYSIVKGTLTDIAPTVLELIGLNKPAEMTGVSLVKKVS